LVSLEIVRVYRAVVVVVLLFVEGIYLAEVVAHRAHVISDYVHHYPHVSLVGFCNEVFEVLL
jgi:hypothetical protein